jgi:hypothetical protein
MNPCLDDEFVQIVPQNIPAVDHMPMDPTNPQHWTFPEFVIITEPIEHTLCGGVDYSVIASDLGSLLSFNEATNKFSLDLYDGDYDGFSADYTLLG